ncbi:MAG: hypothetical protein LBI69_04760 [Puniceicoccales bacterium]|nr:hypothetical protein [Puniceicoccales bacterium]
MNHSDEAAKFIASANSPISQMRLLGALNPEDRVKILLSKNINISTAIKFFPGVINLALASDGNQISVATIAADFA